MVFICFVTRERAASDTHKQSRRLVFLLQIDSLLYLLWKMHLPNLRDQLLFSCTVFKQKGKEKKNNGGYRNNHTVSMELYFLWISLFLICETLFKAWVTLSIKAVHHGTVICGRQHNPQHHRNTICACEYNPYTNTETAQLLLVILQEFHYSEAAAWRVDSCNFPTKVSLWAVKNASQCTHTNTASRNRWNICPRQGSSAGRHAHWAGCWFKTLSQIQTSVKPSSTDTSNVTFRNGLCPGWKHKVCLIFFFFFL